MCHIHHADIHNNEHENTDVDTTDDAIKQECRVTWQPNSGVPFHDDGDDNNDDDDDDNDVGAM